jgi:plasmid stabilization system protein ParE
VTRRKIIWYPSALGDLDQIVEHLESAGSDLNAERVIDRIDAAVASLRLTALRGRVVLELAAHGITRYRELIERPWRIVYRVEPREVFVLAVVDARRRLDELLLERLVRAS